MGTYQIAMVAKTLKKPFYVAVESYKFARMYPLTHRDVRDMCLSATYHCDHAYSNNQNDSSNSSSNSSNTGNKIERNISSVKSQSMVYLNRKENNSSAFDHLNLTIDFTPAEYITLLFTDLGVLTPAAVSDELIRLYQ